MKETSMTVTEATRNFSDCVRRVLNQNVTIRLLKHGRPIGRLVPDHEKVCFGRDLAKVLEAIGLPADEAKVWCRDLRAGRKALKAPVNKG